MRRLSKQQQQEKERLATTIAGAVEEVESRVDTYNEACASAFTPVREAVEELNAIIAEAAEFCDAIHQQTEDYYHDKSDRWRESEAGEQFDAWMMEWSRVTLDEVELGEPEELYSPDMPSGAGLDDLPCEP